MTVTDAEVARDWRRKISRSVKLVLAFSAIAVVLSLLAVYNIQQERRNNVRVNCAQQNERHDGAIFALDVVLDRARDGVDARGREQIEQSRAATVLLIDALAPVQDCEKRVDELVGSSPVDLWPF